MALIKPEEEYGLPKGFRWSGAAAEIRKPGKLDVGLGVSENPVSAAGVFTQNKFSAPPVQLCRELLKSATPLFGVVANSGCANAATGPQGMTNAREMSELPLTSASTDGRFLVFSTGTIGVQLPMEKVKLGITSASGQLGSTKAHFEQFADSILTTDTIRKVASASFTVDDKSVHVLGCAKGSGMMAPNMATLLSFVFTDAEVPQDLLKEVWCRVNEKSLNCITIDGDTSTNDSSVVLANGASGVSVSKGSDTAEQFEVALLSVMQSLAKQLARDGEGATKLIEIEVCSAPSFETARRAGLAIGNSNLIKTAIYGRDANWGRIACALGYSGVPLDPEKVSIFLGPLLLFKDGAPLPLDEEMALEVLSQEFVRIQVDLGSGTESATVWSCDLTEKYIEINGSYRT